MGYEIIYFFQSFRLPFLDNLFITFDYIFSFYFYIIAIILFYIFWNRRISLGLLLVCIITFVLNLLLKYIIQLPPPSPSEITIIADSGKALSPYGFPSLSVQLATTFWFYLFLKVRKNWLAIISAIMIVILIITKLYLGAHFPIDVFGGVIIGVIVVWGFVIVEKRYDNR